MTPGNHFMLGDLDATGWLIIGIIVLGSLGGLLLVIIFIFVKVFRGRKQEVTALNLNRPQDAEAAGTTKTV